ncbi:ABC transporter ATP-binding protein [Frankia sp. CNm7]|uniref:ABC transporter ATP-binding protein n=1 Tax=Frankia nepalensis TaxID=1836974 RepID=A0A937URL8_9ACTN|nr:ABC transporter ATP-binding protein [Frankia nepalensis]MBL7499830.1 ABC transporter ATP-binding protein [Frankia nepalensis]MBL7513647.1 ABC transporter ATP-binding protein [Frankia nepalensis]MBL7521910.1 ABC transporter ATP-binding protein [Frankia nepalensis]MBL7631258.1 ABC transporter ATP-binding protein [Frankia nepalensis]
MSAPAPAEPSLGRHGMADLSGAGPWRLVAAGLRATPVLREGLVVTAVLALLAGTGRVIAPLTVQRAIDAGLTPGAVRPAVAVGSVALVVAGVSSLLLNQRLASRVERALAELRRAGLRRVHDMAATTADRVPSADLVTRLTSDVDQVTTFLQGGGLQSVTNVAQLLVAAVIMIAYSWELSLPVLALAALLVAAMVSVQRVIARRFDRARRDLSAMQSAVAESVIGAPVIRATGTDERTRARLDEAVDRARDSLLRTLPPLHVNTSLGELAISTTTVAVLVGGVWWAGGPGTPRLTAGELVAMVFLVTFFVRPLQFLVQSLGEAQNALTGWRRALELVTTPSAEVRDGTPLPPGPVGVRMEHVSARYGDGPLVLREVNVQIEPGEHVAVVGRTGSGKSTFAKLLTRRIEPAEGTITLSGVPLGQIADASLPGRVVIVPQDPFLFEGTLGANIALGSPGATDADVLAVLAELGLADWFGTLPEGLDTPVGLRGDRLSVGERQLVALARTALVGPDLVVLDEATSGVDAATDVAVQRALGSLTRGRTTVSIAHRMITAATADRVLVFAAGRIVQSGHHSTLLVQEGPYAGLAAAWDQRVPADPPNRRKR